ncbi:uncharacterized protein BO96DRAFT_328245 [Aspergillus niger CBS 101883]|uniref:Uncharacterized protein n=2 Tax=Aspergillus niger TaxID=5061 RepID=A2QPJ5_ASPNC|nr:uncharacterized protein BO96DRAFT_328245 [Aspergillus niger CBS 101883]XP_059601102.1 hypothetical protein An07g09670 [Aspergillus niger]PYH60683.1 hypothetical protein BO96DRAFT_328245 [Aspergillus niger CBS 101883]CAK39732.1 hypothetical protein An07g09670 [Aspergillus niger]
MLPVTAILSPSQRRTGGTRIETGEKLRKPEPWMAKKENIIHGTEVQVRTCIETAKALSLFIDSASRMKGHSLAVDGVAQRAFFPLGLRLAGGNWTRTAYHREPKDLPSNANPRLTGTNSSFPGRSVFQHSKASRVDFLD